MANLDNRRQVDFTNDGAGGLIETVVEQSTETFGAEVIARWNVSDEVVLEGNVTYQDAEFSEGANTGNEPARQPEFTGNVAVSYNDGYVDARLAVNYYGEAFANDSNSATLDSHTVAVLNAGYSWAFQNDQTIRLGVSVWNLFDSEGITEGSPRLGNSQVSDGAFFTGRPVLPRRISLTARYDF
ncbi:TonB-dependent receptor [Paraglaciecola aquimarina]|uniref:TonB-dependent receptor n=1 Tax=Paraglaciecola aquimarina TaxID=1235557 RepID=A0ABU3SWE7_9ALTE|nr:TonB-dependent receptor [Paraglaciecola aquimarina]MDU0354320.1 TonB-dependent receptor [Paraglaciecola aquimarina]